MLELLQPRTWVFSDGGRADAGFQGSAGDCFVRAVAIASEQPYREVYDLVNKVAKEMKHRLGTPTAQKSRRVIGSLGNAREGVRSPLFHEVMRHLGWYWTPTMRFGQGCQVHLRPDELPPGRLVVRLTKHIVAVVDGVVHDTYDPSRCGNRCVYGYFQNGLGGRRCSSEASESASGPRPWVPPPPATSAVPAVGQPPGLGFGLLGSNTFASTTVAPALTSARLQCAKTERSAPLEVQPTGFSDDDSDAEVRQRCQRRRALREARRG